MSIHPKILVTSAAGKTGMATALQLLEKKFPVRAFVRTNDARAARLVESGAEIFIGNQYSYADLRKAMIGVQRISHCAPTAPNGLHFGAAFAVAAFEERIEHIVTLSQWLAHPDHPSQITRETWLNDRLVKMLPDATFTINNTGWFADNYFQVLESAAQLGILPLPLGDGDMKGNAPPSNEDIASVSVGALIDPATHAGKTYRPTGPELLSNNEIAAAFGKELGRKVSYMPISEPMFLKALKSLRMPNMFLTEMRQYAEEYRRGTYAIGGATDAVLKVGGREPEPFEAIVRRYVQNRSEAKQTFGNKMRAIRAFINILITPAPDIERLKAERDYINLSPEFYSQESELWQNEHDPAHGYVPDIPNNQLSKGIQYV